MSARRAVLWARLRIAVGARVELERELCKLPAPGGRRRVPGPWDAMLSFPFHSSIVAVYKGVVGWAVLRWTRRLLAAPAFTAPYHGVLIGGTNGRGRFSAWCPLQTGLGDRGWVGDALARGLESCVPRLVGTNLVPGTGFFSPFPLVRFKHPGIAGC